MESSSAWHNKTKHIDLVSSYKICLQKVKIILLPLTTSLLPVWEWEHRAKLFFSICDLILEKGPLNTQTKMVYVHFSKYIFPKAVILNSINSAHIFFLTMFLQIQIFWKLANEIFRKDILPNIILLNIIFPENIFPNTNFWVVQDRRKTKCLDISSVVIQE